MATGKRKGSVVYKLIIIILLGGLFASLYIPKGIWKDEIKNEEECHSRILNLWTAETFYRQKTKSYTTSIDSLIEVLKSDEELMATLDTSYTYSLFPNLDTLETIYSMPLDSIRSCPETGLDYIIAISDSTPLIKIACPNEGSAETVYFFYKKKINNHGSISDGKVTWE